MSDTPPQRVRAQARGSATTARPTASIQILEGLEAVRKRPACTSATPPTAPACTTWCSRWSTTPIDEALAGFCDDIVVTIHTDNSISVVDNGRGIPPA